MSRTSLALSNLRAVVIVIVLAFHAALAYLQSLPVEPYPFDQAPYRWQATPVIDGARFFGFDLFCSWQDISLMSLMFFLSGLFVPGSLRRKGSWTYLSDRLVRIGLPLLAVTLLLIPLAYYPAYAETAADRSVSAFWRHWIALPFWPCGPLWFLWQLLLFNGLAAGIYRCAPQAVDRLGRLAVSSRHRPIGFFLGLTALSALVYVPVALVYSPWDWANIGPLSFQYCRPLHYLVYFWAGCALGAYGLDRGLLATDGPLVRHWPRWVALSIGAWILWALPTSMTLNGAAAPLPIRIAAGLGFALACASGAFALLALCLRFAVRRWPLVDSLSANAYGMYLLHYVFIVWLQYLLLDATLIALAKAALVFGGTLLLSWAAAAALSNLSPAAAVASARRWLGPAIADPAGRLLKQDD